MIRHTRYATAAALLVSAAAFGQAQESTAKKDAQQIKPLRIGDPAPAIDISDWLKGDKVAKFEPGKVYVVEFWATWCGPCRKSMPHISDTQAQYKDYNVTVIGVSDEKPETVKEFLAKDHPDLKTPWDQVIKYTLTTDPDRSTHEAYMWGVGAMGIPTAFIIGKDTKLEWVGHPDSIEQPLQAIAKDNNWDRAAFAKEFEPQAEKNRQALAARVDVSKFTKLLKEDKHAEAYALGESLLEKFGENEEILNQLAWFVVDNPDVKTRNLEFAHKAAARANDLTKGENAAILDTFARVYYEQGDVKNAIRLQRKAVQAAEAGPMADSIKETLKKYEDEFAKKNAPPTE